MAMSVRTWKEASCLYINAGGKTEDLGFSSVKNENIGEVTVVTEEVKIDSLKM